jgi:hypothetical protein
VLYDSHGRALTQLAALLVDDVAVAQEVTQAAFAALHGAWLRLGDGDRALSYLLREIFSRVRSCRAAGDSPPACQPAPPRAGQRAITAAGPVLMALRALPAAGPAATGAGHVASAGVPACRAAHVKADAESDQPRRTAPEACTEGSGVSQLSKDIVMFQFVCLLLS